MSLEREMRRGRFLKARLGVNGSQNASRSLGTSARAGASAVASVINGLHGRLVFSTMPAAPSFVQFLLRRRSRIVRARGAAPDPTNVLSAGRGPRLACADQ